MATVARFSPPGRQGTALGGTQIFNMVGGTLGPVIYSTILGVTGHYSLGFMLLALVPFTMGMRLLWLDRREEATA
jgi:MFS-type transporter involved in bile tolerance (Atg22 family)